MSTRTRKATAAIDPRSQPAYTMAEAARYLKLPAATLRSWVLGRPYRTTRGVGHFRALIGPASSRPPLLSFWNLVEAHVLRSLRADHGVSVKELRKALDYAERELNIERLLLRKELCTEAGELFLDRYGQLISLSASGQIAMRKLFDAHLKRVEWDAWQFPVRLYPFVSAEAPTEDRPIAIDPQISFGRPVIARVGVSTTVIAERLDAGESIVDIAADYDLSVSEIEEAVLYEHAA